MTGHHLDCLQRPVCGQRTHVNDLRYTVSLALVRASAEPTNDGYLTMAYRAARQLYRATGMREQWAYWQDKDLRS